MDLDEFGKRLDLVRRKENKSYALEDEDFFERLRVEEDP